MSNETKLGYLDEEMTRRQFMKISGKSLAGLALSASFLSLLGVTQQEVDAAAVATWAMPQGLLVVNADRCVGCQRCETNCTVVNDGIASMHNSRIKITRNLFSNKNGVGQFASLWVYYPDTCRQCSPPACGQACPVGAIYDEDGIKKVDADKCVGCGICVNACPWHMPTINSFTKKSTKCVNCGACVAGCPTGALSIIPWNKITVAAQKTWVG